MTQMCTKLWRYVCAFSVLALGACATESATANEAELTDLSLVVPEIVVQENEWRAAPESCEDICFDDGFVIAYAENAPDLAVVMREEEVLCVDTWEAVHIELEKVFGDPAPDPMRPMPFFHRLPGR